MVRVSVGKGVVAVRSKSFLIIGLVALVAVIVVLAAVYGGGGGGGGGGGY